MLTLLFPWLCISLLLGASNAMAGNDALTMKATLIWACDEEKPVDKKLKPVSPELAKRLKGIFKWKHYFEVKADTAKIADKATKDFVLSEKCTVKVRNDGPKGYNAQLYGEKVLLKAIDQPAKADGDVVLAGDDKNATAWFVILTPQAGK